MKDADILTPRRSWTLLSRGPDPQICKVLKDQSSCLDRLGYRVPGWEQLQLGTSSPSLPLFLDIHFGPCWR